MTVLGRSVTMRAISVPTAGGPHALRVVDLPGPVPDPDEVLIRSVAVGFNRADAVQREGHYPPPAGAPTLLGLECSGVVVAVGEHCHRLSVGDEVCALLAGGGYAEFVAVPEAQVLPVPSGVELVDAAALPEAAATVLSTFAHPAPPAPGSWVLIHGGSGGVGTFGIQLARALGLRVLATAGSDVGLRHCLRAGAEAAAGYRDGAFVDLVAKHTDGAGVDVVLDVGGAPSLGKNLAVLATDGRLEMIAGMDGTAAELDFGEIMRRRLTIHGSTLRARPVTGLHSKHQILTRVLELVWPLIETGALTPLPPHRVPLFSGARKVHAAHQERALPPGKTILTLG